MLKRYDDFGKLNESSKTRLEIVKDTISKWIGDVQKAEVINTKLQNFLDSRKYGKTLKSGLLQRVWYFLLGNFFSKNDIETNGMIKEFYEILNSTKSTTFESIDRSEQNIKKMILSLFGNANAGLQSLKRGDYKKAKEYSERIFQEYMQNSGFFRGRGEDMSIFTPESITRMKSFINLLASPGVSSISPDSRKSQGVMPRSPRRIPSGESTEKLDNAVKKLVDTF